jgi:hypothetical protein
VLLSLGSALAENLILLLYASDLSLYLLRPIVSLVLYPLVGPFLISADIIKLGLFFDLKESLLDCLGQKYVEDGLHFTIVVEKVIVLNLGDFVYSGLFGYVRWSGRSRHEFISLNSDILLLRLRFPLLCQEISEVYFYLGRRPRSKIVR